MSARGRTAANLDWRPNSVVTKLGSSLLYSSDRWPSGGARSLGTFKLAVVREPEAQVVREHRIRLESNLALLPPAAPHLLDGEQRASLEGGILSVLEVLVEACAGYLPFAT